ncbi:DUF3180 domain-containing protein [Nocardia donostiensis]|uniref:DUF3180 domain-containing protein n=1 Tax=Nocardia donostiensis TaxID=1538463 RepID=A0A1W0BNV6_9NOCA|nr:DUF3180 domain-containing protein [Nocardia donostiensis]ONM47382.1 hypothetical protein B0T46_17525 [Nocardia donostiensis]OQS14392.1 hypothetical protein B0T36_15535 [Nocardia donostiensis]OQS24151.1 hypothetical protein B0T44_00510 [Nocardia donostiensis]
MKLKPTRVRELFANVLIAAVIAWVATRLAYGSFPPISNFAGASLYPVAAIEVVLGFIIRSRINDRQIGDGRHQLHPITAARAVALAKASAQVGSLAAGVWLGFLVWVFPQRGTLRAAAADSPGALIGLGAGVALAAAAVWLEYCCRAPDDPTDDPATT